MTDRAGEGSLVESSPKDEREVPSSKSIIEVDPSSDGNLLLLFPLFLLLFFGFAGEDPTLPVAFFFGAMIDAIQ